MISMTHTTAMQQPILVCLNLCDRWHRYDITRIYGGKVRKRVKDKTKKIIVFFHILK